LKENEETYKFFVEDDVSFEHHLENMKQDGTFGGNMELVAFAKLSKVDIKVYQPGFIYVIKGAEDEDEEEEDERPRQILHIAYHDWEHYSSVRNLDGPFTGPPEIRITIAEQKIEEEEEDDEFDSKEKVVLNACPDASIRQIRRLLKKYKGNPDKVIDALYEENNPENDKENTENDIESTVKNNLENAIESTVESNIENSIEMRDDEDIIEQFNDNKEQIKVEEKLETKVDEVIKLKPKKLTASERKREAKKKQKEAKLLKEQAKAARRSKREKEESTQQNTSLSQNMKEMYI
jgi:OTU domain-containing protein 3